jgi:23S rRNA pseudouridine2605 synthase
MRLNRYLALCGVASRRGSMGLVFSGRVTVNERVVRDPGHVIRSGVDRVALDGDALSTPRRWLFYAFHKPRGVIVTASDDRGRAALETFLRRIPERVFPVGRLDRSSEGLLLLTNHGEVAQALLHPRFEVEKIYRVRVLPRPNVRQLTRLREGVDLGAGEHSAPARVHIKRTKFTGAVLTLTLHEGRKREVRRMCASVGLRVLRLQRVAFAGIRLADLSAGRIRPLTRDEIAHLSELTGIVL